MNVLSICNGMSCGKMALDKLNIKVDNYYSSEIDKYANKMSEYLYPDIIHLGDMTTWREWELPKIDLILAGTPCQGFSFAGKQLAFDDPRSKLFFDFIDILRYYKPKYFLLENVRMKKEYLDVITKMTEVNPIMINSALVSAQNRKRYYWTNIPDIVQPEDKGILLKDIVHEYTDFVGTLKVHGSYKEKSVKSTCIDAHYASGIDNHGQRTHIIEFINKYIVPLDKTLKILDKEVERGKVEYFRKDSQANRVYYIHDKAVTLCGDAGGGAAKMGQYLFGVINKSRGNNKGGLRNDGNKCSTLSSHSWEQNNHLLFGCMAPDRLNKGQLGQRFNKGKKFYTLTAQDKHGILVEGYIRKLTPIECARLQTIPKDIITKMMTAGISNSQIYKMLGNGWTVDVIVYILKHIK